MFLKPKLKRRLRVKSGIDQFGNVFGRLLEFCPFDFNTVNTCGLASAGRLLVFVVDLDNPPGSGIGEQLRRSLRRVPL
jgi:hypothetical protein